MKTAANCTVDGVAKAAKSSVAQNANLSSVKCVYTTPPLNTFTNRFNFAEVHSHKLRQKEDVRDPRQRQLGLLQVQSISDHHAKNSLLRIF